MQSIGGCRAVLSSIEEVRRVQRRLFRNRQPLRVSDYIGVGSLTEKRSTG